MGLLRGWQRLDETGLPLLAARLVVGFLFVRMGWAKLEDPVAFLKLVRQYELAPESVPWLLNGMAIVIPWLEVWLGALLLLGVAVRGVSLALLALLVVFTGAIALRGLGLAESQGLPLCDVAFDCGCGGGVVRACTKVTENLGLALLLVVALLSRSRRFCVAATLLGRRPTVSG